jgi:hypothetical protein
MPPIILITPKIATMMVIIVIPRGRVRLIFIMSFPPYLQKLLSIFCQMRYHRIPSFYTQKKASWFRFPWVFHFKA